VTADTFQGLVVSLVLSRFDYVNATLAGLPNYLLFVIVSISSSDRKGKTLQ